MVDKRKMLASDMDGTVVPLEVNPQREREISAFRSGVAETQDLTLAYVTGRDLPLALKGIRQHRLPVPDTLVCDVGTSVYHQTSSGFEEDTEYVSLMERARGGLDVRDVQRELAHLPGLQLQAEHRQTASKLSYYLSPDGGHPEIMSSVNEVLIGLGGNLQAVYSIGAPHGTGLLDLLPAGVAKDFALRYLHRRVGVDEESLVYAGDSGNDIAAMLTGFNAIVVGNATPGLMEELTSRGGEMGVLDRLYFAEEFYVAGVMEGCRHFGIL
ncbi:MAG: HAD-IIB family hydrolase [Gemmatimonadetes bacterium]|nr:HAD family hydrolase [Gemmatimonadota bacterium]NNM04986.1 HAD-IIB family hydrolase [Gemmatimonadota bacterium]